MYLHSIKVHETLEVSEWLNICVKTYPQTQELTSPDEKCWVNWRKKVPYRLDGKMASPTNPDDWSTFDEVRAVRDRFDGIGIVFTGTMLGIDLDHCLTDGGVSDEIAAVVAEARTYTEVSPSGTGLHLYLSLTEPMELEVKRSPRGRGGDYECYTSGRYFTYTGVPWTVSYPPRRVTPDEALKILNLIGYPWGKQPLQPAQDVPAKLVSLDDEALLQKMFSSTNGAKIKALYNGDTSAHGGDDSSADAALCSHLAFWTGKDSGRVISLWLASPLGARSKTQNRKDYRERTVTFAIAGCTEVYEAPVSISTPSVQLQGEQKVSLESSSALTFISDYDLLNLDIPPVDWQIEPFFEKGTLNMISAAPNQYKSWLVLRMALSSAHGLQWLGQFETSKTNVLVVSEEDGHAKLKNRYSMLLQDGEASGGIFFVVQSGRKIDLKWAQEIRAFAETHNIEFVILDSLRALHLMKENDSDAMQPVMDTLNYLTRNGLTVLFTHHHRKGQQGMGTEPTDGGMDMARGSSAITAAVHGHITCQEKLIAGVPHIIVHQAKLKAAAKMEPFSLRIDSQLEPEHISFRYAGPYDAEMGAAEAMEARIMAHTRANPDERLTRNHLAELKFAKSGGDQTLRVALTNLVEKKKLVSKRYDELDGIEQLNLPDKKDPKANSLVYWLAPDA